MFSNTLLKKGVDNMFISNMTIHAYSFVKCILQGKLTMHVTVNNLEMP